MEVSVANRATCPLCFGQLGVVLAGDPGEQIELKVCRFCGTLFGPPWPERQWTEPSSEPVVLYALEVKKAGNLPMVPHEHQCV